jgi:hypothetical protein
MRSPTMLLTSLGGTVENFDELIQRLLEVQSGGRQRSPKLIAEDERLIDGLRLAARPAQTMKLGQATDRTVGEK